jgi:hypothetical protein
MSTGTTNGGDDRQCDDFYRRCMEVLRAAGVPFLMGGAYAFGIYTGIHRNTKDFDVFVGGDDFERALNTLGSAGFESENTFPHWLGKVKNGKCCIDLIYQAGNGLCEVDESWFARARDAETFGLSVKMCAPEELIWMKAFIMERERFDGADVAHLFEGCAEEIDWPHLVRRFGSHWQVLLSHLIFFTYIFPSERGRMPPGTVDQLVQRWRDERPSSFAGRLCRGTLLSREQYLPDIRERGFQDARLEGPQRLDPEDILHWTKAIG